MGTLFCSILMVRALQAWDANEIRLIELLEHPRFSVRERSMSVLEKRMHFRLYAAIRYAAPLLNAEGKRRALRLMRAYEKRVAASYKSECKGYRAYPWIGPAGDCDFATQQYYLKLAVAAGAKESGFPDYSSYRKATELWARDWLDSRVAQAMRISMTEKEFRSRIIAEQHRLGQVLSELIRQEDVYWQRQKIPNPMRRRAR